jgi:hypothetical protein
VDRRRKTSGPTYCDHTHQVKAATARETVLPSTRDLRLDEKHGDDRSRCARVAESTARG